MGGSRVTPNQWEYEAQSIRREMGSQRRGECSHGFAGDRENSSFCSGFERNPKVVLCDCGVPSPVVTTWTRVNQGRKFYGCGLFEVNRKKVCNFFQWFDSDESAREKKLVVVLTKRIEEKQKMIVLLSGTLVIAIVCIMVLGVAYVRK
ncbi:uncharacterized protein LOC130744608 [Lotus japonicus]|uniref:uncharacterized protein LOC130744608 n=1 Tax=Lotus japonicus TaxID=34305 RepID=UPI00258CB166|nr:uncharacterized protein LOC130744608 [Lotus japonicus]